VNYTSQPQATNTIPKGRKAHLHQTEQTNDLPTSDRRAGLVITMDSLPYLAIKELRKRHASFGENRSSSEAVSTLI
jgi:hypothetical protein